MKEISAREAAYLSLKKTLESGAYVNLERQGAEAVRKEDRAFYSALYSGSVQRKITLDYLLSKFCATPVNELDLSLLALLESGAYQILYLSGVPDRAAVNETVALAKKVSPRAAGLVNAVLRRIAAEKDTVPSLLDHPGKKGLSLRYSIPKYLISLWTQAYGKDVCEAVLKALNERPALSVRVNEKKIARKDYEKILEKNGIRFHPNRICENALTPDSLSSPLLLPGWNEGWIFVQDAAAQRAVERLGITPGAEILDVCSAPGGKAFLAKILAGETGRVTALELRENRLPLIRSGAARLGLHLDVFAHDSTRPFPNFSGKADFVICDVPCSGYGVIAKKPDIRLKKEEESASLPALQGAILAAAAESVKPGGRLLYATCTLSPKENEKVTDAFLSDHPSFRRLGVSETVFPAGGENDGFFSDVLERIL